MDTTEYECSTCGWPADYEIRRYEIKDNTGIIIANVFYATFPTVCTNPDCVMNDPAHPRNARWAHRIDPNVIPRGNPAPASGRSIVGSGSVNPGHRTERADRGPRPRKQVLGLPGQNLRWLRRRHEP